MSDNNLDINDNLKDTKNTDDLIDTGAVKNEDYVPKFRFDWGIAVAVFAVIVLLTGIGFLSEQARQGSNSSQASSESGQNFTSEMQEFVNILNESKVETETSGIVETYLSSNGDVLGKMFYMPAKDKDVAVIYIAETDEYIIDLANTALTMSALSNPDSIKALSNFNIVKDGDSYTLERKENSNSNSNSICNFVTVEDGLVTSLMDVDCATKKPFAEGIITEMSYNFSEEDIAMFEKGMVTGQPADQLQQPQQQPAQ